MGGIGAFNTRKYERFWRLTAAGSRAHCSVAVLPEGLEAGNGGILLVASDATCLAAPIRANTGHEGLVWFLDDGQQVLDVVVVFHAGDDLQVGPDDVFNWGRFAECHRRAPLLPGRCGDRVGVTGPPWAEREPAVAPRAVKNRHVWWAQGGWFGGEARVQARMRLLGCAKLEFDGAYGACFGASWGLAAQTGHGAGQSRTCRGAWRLFLAQPEFGHERGACAATLLAVDRGASQSAGIRGEGLPVRGARPVRTRQVQPGQDEFGAQSRRQTGNPPSRSSKGAEMEEKKGYDGDGMRGAIWGSSLAPAANCRPRPGDHRSCSPRVWSSRARPSLPRHPLCMHSA